MALAILSEGILRSKSLWKDIAFMIGTVTIKSMIGHTWRLANEPIYF